MSKVTPNLGVEIAAPPKCGKTRFALTFPDPIVVYSFDLRGAECLIPDFPDKKIVIRKFLAPLVTKLEVRLSSKGTKITDIYPTRKAADYIQLLEDILQQFNEDLGLVEGREPKEPFKTVVLDPATTLRRIIDTANAQALEMGRVPSLAYQVPNAHSTYFLMQPLYLGMNVVSIHYLREKYVGDKATGEMIPDGFKDTPGLMDVVMQIERIGKKKDVKFISTITDCRFDKDLTGETLPDNADYKDLAIALGMDV